MSLWQYYGLMVYCVWVVLHLINCIQFDNYMYINLRNGDSCWLELLLSSCGRKHASHIRSSTTGGNVLHCDNDWSVLCILYDVLGFTFPSSEPNRRRGSQLGQGKLLGQIIDPRAFFIFFLVKIGFDERIDYQHAQKWRTGERIS